eukprot:364624-Chlamydomonas_euryale.AAC.2
MSACSTLGCGFALTEPACTAKTSVATSGVATTGWGRARRRCTLHHKCHASAADRQAVAGAGAAAAPAPARAACIAAALDAVDCAAAAAVAAARWKCRREACRIASRLHCPRVRWRRMRSRMVADCNAAAAADAFDATPNAAPAAAGAGDATAAAVAVAPAAGAADATGVSATATGTTAAASLAHAFCQPILRRKQHVVLCPPLRGGRLRA